MGQIDNIYSVFVNWAKIILPMAALALLSTLFLLSNRAGDSGDIPFAEIEEIARETRLTHPNFSGVSANGTVFEIAAKLARPNPADPDLFEVELLSLGLQTPDGNRVEVTSVHAELDSKAKVARLDGLAQIQTSNGYQMETTGLIATYDTGQIESLGPLEIRAPYGTLTAGKLLVETAAETGSSLIIFKEGVRLIYRPNQ